MKSKVSLALSVIWMIVFFIFFIISNKSIFAIILGIALIAILTASCYTHYKNIKKDSLKEI